MSLNTVKDWLKRQQNTVAESITRFKNKDFMEAVVAGCALVAAADGDISAEEKQKMAGFISRNDALKVFDMSQVIERFNAQVESFAFDHSIGKAQALRVIGRLKNNPEAGRLLVRVCCAIGLADGDFDADEQAVVRDICAELGLPAEDFGLTETPATNSSADMPKPAAPPVAPSPVAPSPAEPEPKTEPLVKPPLETPMPPTASYVTAADNKAFMEASTATAALLLTADNDHSAAKQQQVREALTQHPALQNFPAEMLNKQFKRALDNLSFNRTIGKADIQQRLSWLKNQPEAAQALVQVCLAVSRSDGHFSPAEQQEMRELCQLLAVEAKIA